jgi:hypothetical protein
MIRRAAVERNVASLSIFRIFEIERKETPRPPGKVANAIGISETSGRSMKSTERKQEKQQNKLSAP